MRRGTLALLGCQPPILLPTFRKSCLYRPPFMPLLFRFLEQHDFAIPDELRRMPFRLYHGDCVALGRGEIFLRDSS
jgi:formylmethanofuran dehydrogenase subunit C